MLEGEHWINAGLTKAVHQIKEIRAAKEDMGYQGENIYIYVCVCIY